MFHSKGVTAFSGPFRGSWSATSRFRPDAGAVLRGIGFSLCPLKSALGILCAGRRINLQTAEGFLWSFAAANEMLGPGKQVDILLRLILIYFMYIAGDPMRTLIDIPEEDLKLLNQVAKKL